MKIELELSAARRLMGELQAQLRIKRRVSEAARRKADSCQCVLCVARRTGDPMQIMAAMAELATGQGQPPEPGRPVTH